MLRIQKEILKLNENNPYNKMDKEELDDIFLKLNTIVWIIKNKKITKNMFFVFIMEYKEIRNTINEICSFNDDRELYKEILMRYPDITSSKLVKNNLHKHDFSDNI